MTDSPHRRRPTTLARIAIGALALTAAACTEPSGPSSGKGAAASEAPFVLPANVPDLVLHGPGDMAETLRLSALAEERATTGISPALSRANHIPAELLPLLYETDAGHAFRSMPDPRVLLIGEPSETCPALAAGTGPSMRTALEAGFTGCRTELAANGAPESCGCRLIARDETLLAPRDAFAYAPGLAARVVVDGRLTPVHYVAEERPGGGILLFAGRSPAWAVLPDGPHQALLVPFDRAGDPVAPALQASRKRLALERGRYHERLDTTAPDGSALSLLIGF